MVLVDFWTYTCINCIRTFPALKEWDRHYRDRGLTIVGVHTPEFAFERRPGNVREAIEQNGLAYPVAQDNEYATWNAWGNQFWPAKYLIDARGQVRYTHFGEGDYDETDRAIRALLAEAGRDRLGPRARARTQTADPGVRTPETYLGIERAKAFLPAPPAPGRRRYPGVRGDLPPNHFALQGTWRATVEAATAVRDASLRTRFTARRVFLVMRSKGGRPRRVEVSLDGRALDPVTVTGDRLYTLVDLSEAGEHRLSLRFAPGVTAYAFTFG